MELDILTSVGLVALMVKFTSVAKFVEEKEWKKLRVQVYAWVIGVLGILLASQVQGLQDQLISNVALRDMSFWTLLYVGLGIGSTGSLVADTLRAVDNKSSTSV